MDFRNRRIHFANGCEDQYDALISSVPLDQLASLTGYKPWIEAASRLKRSATHIVGVGLRGRAPAHATTKCWMYFPEDNCPFYRVTHFSLYSPNNVDDINAHWSLMCETSESPNKPVDSGRIVEETVRGLAAVGLIEGADQVDHTWLRRVEYGYPTPTRDRDAVVNRLLPELAQWGIFSRGRFGEVAI